jgi:hypothetical protein
MKFTYYNGDNIIEYQTDEGTTNYNIYNEHSFNKHNLTNNLNYKNILYIVEPPDIINNIIKKIYNSLNKFDIIITIDPKILNHHKNTICYNHLMYTSWISNITQIPKKQFKISFLINNKMITDGHKFRYKIWTNQKKITTPYDFYIGSSATNKNALNINNNKIFGKKDDFRKDDLLYPYMFHVCVENKQMNNWITEKVNDCFITCTIPIYWGAPNIGDYYDINGIICFETINQLIDILNNLTEKDYNDKLDAVEKNRTTYITKRDEYNSKKMFGLPDLIIDYESKLKLESKLEFK